jgi:hypothetical protein
LGEATDVVAGDFGSSCGIEDFEVNAIEASYASFGCNPNVTVGGLEDLMNGVLGEAVLGGPGLITQAVWSLAVSGGREGCDSA